MPIDGVFYGATLAQVKVKADPKQFAPMWTNANPAKPKAQFLAKNTASGELGQKSQAGSIARARNAISFSL
jgi:hypothetical protein